MAQVIIEIYLLPFEIAIMDLGAGIVKEVFDWIGKKHSRRS